MAESAFNEYQHQLRQLIQIVVAASEDDFSHGQKSPTITLRRFQKQVDGFLVPILFKSFAGKLKMSLSGISRNAGWSGESRQALFDCISLTSQIEAELNIDIAKQISLTGSYKTKLRDYDKRQLDQYPIADFSCFASVSKLAADTMKETICQLTYPHDARLDESKFVKMREFRNFASPKAILSELKIDANLGVLCWIDKIVIATNWDQIRSMAEESILNDNYVMSPTVDWLLLFWHEDEIQFGLNPFLKSGCD